MPQRGQPGGAGPPRRPRVERLRIAAAIASALVLLVSGSAWGLYRDITAGITTTDVIAGSGSGGDQNILLVGVDARTDSRGDPLPPELLAELGQDESGGLNSDTVILLHVPEDGSGATGFSIPRDSYVDIPGYRRDKINAAYPAMSALAAERLVGEGERDHARIAAQSLQEGRSALIGAVEGLTGMTVDHYAEINLLGFYNLTTAIGGVEVCLNAPVDDHLSGARFAAGPQSIAGRDALAFVRQRHGLPDGDLSRIRRQQVFLAAVAEKTLSAGTLTDPSALAALIDVAQRSLTVDEGLDLLGFARHVVGITGGDIEFVTIPDRGPESNTRGDVLLVDRFEVQDFIAGRLSDDPVPEVSDEQAAPPRFAEAGRYLVDVENASGTDGLAAEVSDDLVAIGFRRGTVGNADPASSSSVRHRDSPDAAGAVAQRLGDLEVVSDAAVGPGRVVATLGSDFTAPPPIPAMHPAAAAATPGPAPGPAPGAPITAAGVPCID